MSDLPSREDARHLDIVLLTRALHDDLMHDVHLIVAAYVEGRLVDQEAIDWETRLATEPSTMTRWTMEEAQEVVKRVSGRSDV